MAKLNANGRTELARYEHTNIICGMTVRTLFAFMSDGHHLYKNGDAKWQDRGKGDSNRLARALETQGYTRISGCDMAGVIGELVQGDPEFGKKEAETWSRQRVKWGKGNKARRAEA